MVRASLSQTVYDLRLSAAGVKRWVVRFVFHRFICWNCKKPFQHCDRKPKYGSALIAYVLYQLFEMHVTQNVIGQGLARLPFEYLVLNLNTRQKSVAFQFFPVSRHDPLLDRVRPNAEIGIESNLGTCHG